MANSGGGPRESRTPDSRRRDPASTASARPDGRRRVVVEKVLPSVDDGRFPVKRTVGESVDVIAHVHADGHDVLVAVLRYRLRAGADAAPWTEIRMIALGNDEWRASFVVEQLGVYEYSVQGWVDHFLSWRRGVAIKTQAGMDVTVDLQEGAALVAATAAAAPDDEAGGQAAGDADADRMPSDRAHLAAAASLLAAPTDSVVRIAAALDQRLLSLMAKYADRALASDYHTVLQVTVDRPRARFGAWYEMFPRSWGPDATRSATFDEAAAHLPRVAALGFDVVYLPPIHPIGTSYRKGRRNSLVAQPGDPGSPWAIGSSQGGHTAVEPGLGSLDDFDAFVAAAGRVNLEVALDLAFQCSPDHPYVREHPEWFRHRPDGTIKYAENPPKKYQDIYPFNFETTDWQALWNELLEVTRFWIAHGVRIFRVDNPHTKPYPFWQWLIATIHRDHPDVIFLAEAFARPKIMYYLAKLGFTQSYTYFTWRNTREELEEYFTELTASEVKEFFRPNLFANTPDILHEYLQSGGQAAFKVRLILASTLGATYGIYSGFELGEGRAVPGTEEYLDSEKYQIGHWDWDRPGNIRELVAALNRIRRQHPALQFDRGLRFHETDNPAILCYTKTSPDRADTIMVVVNLDPARMQHGHVRVPVGMSGLPDAAAFAVQDLLTGTTYNWIGEWNYVRLVPPGVVAHVLRIGVTPSGDRA